MSERAKDRPVVALTVAILAGSIVDYELISDHTRPGCALGLPSGNGEVSGDLAMARFIAKRDGGGSTSALLGGPSEEGAALMLQGAWRCQCHCQSVEGVAIAVRVSAGAHPLNEPLVKFVQICPAARGASTSRSFMIQQKRPS